MDKKTKYMGILFVLPSLLGVGIFYVFPFFMSITYCFTQGGGKRKFVKMNNFTQLLNNQAYALAIKNTLTITIIALPLLCIFSLLIALLIERDIQKYRKMQTVLLVPLFLPAASVLLVWQHLFEKNGILNAMLSTQTDWLNSPYAKWIIIGLIIWKNIGYNVILIVSVLLDIPKEYEEAASLDGAGFWNICRNIKIPFMIPMLFFVFIISLHNSFKIFKEVYLLQGNYPYKDLYLLQHFMNNNFTNLNYEMLASAAMLLYIIIFTIIYVIAKLQHKYYQNNLL